VKNIIKHDLFNIAKRLKKINKNYIVCFNRPKNRYEIHDLTQIGTSLCFCLSKPKLNYTAILKALKTQTKNAKKLILAIDESNLKLKNTKENFIKDKYLDKFKSYVSYINSTSKEIDFSKVDKTTWV